MVTAIVIRFNLIVLFLILSAFLVTHTNSAFAQIQSLYQQHVESGQRGFNKLPSAVRDFVLADQSLNERHENLDIFESIKSDSTLDPKYLPENHPVFFLTTYLIPESDAQIFGYHDVPPQLIKTIGGSRFLKFLVHPASLSYFKKGLAKYSTEQEYLATPLASHRSLVVWSALSEEEPLNVKVSLDAVIGQSHRMMWTNELKRQSVISKYIKAIPHTDFERLSFRILDEPAGFVPHGFEAGMSLRDLPQAKVRGNEIVSLFTLFAKGNGSRPRIVDLIQQSGATPMAFLERFILPIVDQYYFLALEFGLTSEPHEQNLLVEISKNQITGIIHKDFGGFSIDPRFYYYKFGRSGGPLIYDELASARSWSTVASLSHYFRDSALYALAQSLKGTKFETSFDAIKDAFQERARLNIARFLGQPYATYHGALRGLQTLELKLTKAFATYCDTLGVPKK